MTKGECNCGAVAFEIEGNLGDIYMCHCSICRSYTGTNGIAVVVVPNNRFRWLRGEKTIRSWTKPDADWQSHFCGTCGSALPGPNDPERMFVPVGTIRGGTEGLAVAHHIWVGSKADWDCIGDQGKQHDGPFEG